MTIGSREVQRTLGGKQASALKQGKIVAAHMTSHREKVLVSLIEIWVESGVGAPTRGTHAL